MSDYVYFKTHKMKRPLFSLFAILFLFHATAQDCLSGWKYYRNIQVDNTQGSDDLENYAVRFVANTAQLVSQGKLQDSGADLRFVDSDCNLLPYYMDSLATSTQNAIWVKIPFLAAGASTSIRVYYGNASAAPASNGAATFLFFDDFEDGVIDTEKWESIGEYATFDEADGVLDYASTGTASGARFKFARTVPSFQDPAYMECAANVGTSSTIGFSSANNALERIYFRYNNGSIFADTMDIVAHLGDTMTNGFAFDTDYPLIAVPKEQMNNLRIKVVINEEGHLSIMEFSNLDNGQTNANERVITQYDMTNGFHFCLSSFSTGSHALLEYVRLRPAAETEPTASMGGEMSNPLTGLQDLKKEAEVLVFPNPARYQCQIHLPGTQQIKRIELFDARGALLLETDNPKNPQQVNLSGIPQQACMLKVTDSQGRLYTRQLIVAGDE